jgi:hypothetical protein
MPDGIALKRQSVPLEIISPSINTLEAWHNLSKSAHDSPDQTDDRIKI